MSFSSITEAVILFSVPAVFWHVLMVQVLGKVPVTTRVITGAVVIGWTAFAYASVRYGLDDQLFGDTPLVFAGYLLIPAILALMFQNSLLGRGVSQQALIALQLFRPIGMVFVLEHSRGTLPAEFGIPAGWGDLLAGIVAAIVLIRYPTGRIPTPAILLVAFVGLADFASAIFLGITSSANEIQLFAFDNPNRVGEYPLGLIPEFLVPYAIVAHVLSLLQLRRDTKT